MMEELIAGFLVTFIGLWVVVSFFLWLCEMLGLFAVIPEGETRVYMLFGKVVGTIAEPGLHLLWRELGIINGLLANWMGTCFRVDMRLDQHYLRSQPVNSEEGAPMGIGIWYEMFIKDPVAYLFKNESPRESLTTNVQSAAVRCLSNMALESLLEDRHTMSQVVRTEVSAHSLEWGYQAGSVYIRKVHFRDRDMIAQIEEKVVNRLRQVTSAIRQDGANQVSIITSTAEKEAAAEFAKAGAVRPAVVGDALRQICADGEIAQALFEILETQRLMAGDAEITLLPKGKALLPELLAGNSDDDRPGSRPGRSRSLPSDHADWQAALPSPAPQPSKKKSPKS